MKSGQGEQVTYKDVLIHLTADLSQKLNKLRKHEIFTLLKETKKPVNQKYCTQEAML
jgi:hypothetical protein